MYQKFIKQFRHAPAVIPAEAGIQTLSNFWISGRASFGQLARNDYWILE
jgi:hypothetical protein